MKLQKIKETCLYVEDLQATKAFYHDILGLPIISVNEDRHVFFRVGEDVLLCFLPEVTMKETSLPHHFGYGQQHFAFECLAEDYEKWKEKLEESGIDIEHEATWENGLKSIYFRDPDFHSVEIVVPGIWD
ncbi:MAG: VOC family protein [Chitinophagales bacterium]